MTSSYEPLILPLRPGEVLAQQARLHDALARPDIARGHLGQTMAGFIHGFAARVDQVTQGHSYEDMMFAPYRPSASRKQASQWCGAVARGLFDAASFQVTAEMVDAVTGVYEKSAEGLFHVEEASLPSLSGFCWLDKPMVVTDKWGRKVAERAITWSPVTIPVRYSVGKIRDGLGRMVEAPVFHEAGVRVATWSYIEDDRKLLEEAQAEGNLPEYLRFADSGRPEANDYQRLVQETGKPWDYLWEEFDFLASLGDLSLSHSMVVLFGERHPWSFGKAPHPQEAKGDFRPDNMLAWLHALWMFMGTEIVTTRKSHAGRASLRRIAKDIVKTIKQNEVGIVILRRSVLRPVSTDDAETQFIDWSCRWLVSGHHRHIDSYLGAHHHAVPKGGIRSGKGEHDVCAICWSRGETVRITWVKPFLKGPEDAPLKSSKQLQKLMR